MNKEDKIVCLLEEILRCLKFFILYTIKRDSLVKTESSFIGLISAWKHVEGCLGDEIADVCPQYKYYAEKYKNK